MRFDTTISAKTQFGIKDRPHAVMLPNRTVVKYFIVILMAIGAVFAGTIGIFYKLEARAHLADIRTKETFSVELQHQIISRSFKTITADLRILSSQNELHHWLSAPTTTDRKGIEQEYLALSRHRNWYDQIRYMDEFGNERVRINFHSGQPATVPESDLQFKGNRYYFQDTIVLNTDEVFVSPFDLNIEQGKIEQPLKPMIRFGTPVIDAKGNKRGVIMLNYLGRHLIEDLRQLSTVSLGGVMLVNRDGFWLCHPNPQREWGFMMPVRAQYTFVQHFPQAWNAVTRQSQGQIITANGMFTYLTVRPLAAGLRSSTGASGAYDRSQAGMDANDYWWKIVSHIPATDLARQSHELLLNLFILFGVLFLSSSVPAWLIAQAVVRRKFYREKLWQTANHDHLTRLPNRLMFLERLGQTFREAQRYKRRFALLFIDLDGFKGINDTLGHNAGDALLMEVSDRLRQCLRTSDTVARIGGDEFTVLLPELNSDADAEIVARKVLSILGRPFNFDYSQPCIGASVGIAVYPSHGKDVDTLLKNADAAMYQVKRSGKHSYRFYETA